MTVPQLPSGTVTFVFTDVEGSTRLLHELGAEAYAVTLAEHRRVVRAACEAHGGVEVDTQGDAFFFAFATAPGALAAAADLTEGLDEGPIRVRVGVHTGTPLVGPEGYVGRDVHRAARIAAAGHGGQVLVSASTCALVDTDLLDLGEHRFKDLDAPERVFQLGTGEYPALKSLYRTNLPIPATPFLGRERELAEVVELLAREDVRLLTVTGPGGTGKTRLSLQGAAEVSDGFPDGVFWVPLAPLRDASLLETTFAHALDVSEQAGTAIADSIVAAFAGKRALVVVDNCEHLVDAVAGLLRTLVERSPKLVVVASSRELLGLRSERVFSVPPMAPTDSELLFVERARAVQADFEPDERVAAICATVEGLPLAIELAAARVRALSTNAILERLDERLALLTSRDRDVEERQRTLEATIAWSYDLLDPAEQQTLRGLSVFAGGCTLEAANEVAAADFDLLESLVDKSLLRHRVDEAGQDRFWMLETIREYASTQLTADEEESRGSRHTQLFVSVARQLAERPSRGRTAEELTRFQADRSNFRLALQRAIEIDDTDNSFRLIRFLGPFWYSLRELAESYTVMTTGLALVGGNDHDRAYAMFQTAAFAHDLGEVEDARALLAGAESFLEVAGDLPGLAMISNSRSFLESTLGNAGDAMVAAERAIGLARRVGDQDLESRASARLSFALQVYALADDPPDREALLRSRALDQARLTQVRTQGSPLVEAAALVNLGFSLYLLGELDDALQHVQQGAQVALTTGKRLISEDVLLIGFIAAGLGQNRVGVMLVTAAQREYEQEGLVMQATDVRILDKIDHAAREALGNDGYEDAVRAGEALTREEAIELALSLHAGQSSLG
jgi:predicted ATPase/class 3 adenylate cyclase